MRHPVRILILGDQGQVAWELRRTLSTLGEVSAVGRHSAPLAIDLSDSAAILPLVEAVRPDWIVNAAAHTAVDQAETERDAAYAINATAPAELALAALRVGARLVHYSTDYVFDGRGQRPYREDDPTAPLGVYGASKLAGEDAIRETGVDHLILRTAWVYGARGGNFMRTIRRLAREREELRIVADQYGAPTWSRQIAEATAQMLVRLGQDAEAWRALGGTYHLTSAGEASWHEFAAAIVAHQRQHEPVKVERVLPIPGSDYPTPARRPAYSVLDCSKLADHFGIRLPHWRDALRLVQEELTASV